MVLVTVVEVAVVVVMEVEVVVVVVMVMVMVMVMFRILVACVLLRTACAAVSALWFHCVYKRDNTNNAGSISTIFWTVTDGCACGN